MKFRRSMINLWKIITKLHIKTKEMKANEVLKKGIDAMYDEMIDAHLKVLTQQPFTSSVQYFVESGKCSGSFRLQLRSLLKKHDEICLLVQKEYAKQKCEEQKMLVAEEVLKCVEYSEENAKMIRLICKNSDEPKFD